jgi:hypothetical protein
VWRIVCLEMTVGRTPSACARGPLGQRTDQSIVGSAGRSAGVEGFHAMAWTLTAATIPRNSSSLRHLRIRAGSLLAPAGAILRTSFGSCLAPLGSTAWLVPRHFAANDSGVVASVLGRIPGAPSRTCRRGRRPLHHRHLRTNNPPPRFRVSG